MINCIEVKNLTKEFEDTKKPSNIIKTIALDNISFNIKKGKMVSVLGADGSGKTTLLRLLVGLLLPTNGKILTLNFNPKTQKANIIEKTGYMPQKFGLYEDLTVKENLELYSKLKSNKTDEREAALIKEELERLLNFTTLKPFEKRLAGDLSGGMKQKLGLACALFSNPELLVLDEPSVGVDPISRIELLNLVKRSIQRNSKHTSVIWSSSYLDEAFEFDLSIILDKGKIIFEGDTKTLGDNLEAFENKVIELMGGYHYRDSEIAKNYFVKEHDNDCIVLADKLSKRFGNFWAVKENSFCIKKGEIFGLLGPNGAGKSTTFKMMAALLKPTSGRGFIMGYDIEREPEKARGALGYMAQKFSLYSRLSVLDNLEFFSGIYGLKRKDKKRSIQEILDVFELNQYKNTLAPLLPLGFKQRLSLGCALIHQPPVLFLDEPTSGVDVIQRKEFWTHIKALAKIGVSVLVTTHFMDEARFCDNISLFYNGEIIALDTPLNLMKKANAKSVQETFIKMIKDYKDNTNKM